MPPDTSNWRCGSAVLRSNDLSTTSVPVAVLWLREALAAAAVATSTATATRPSAERYGRARNLLHGFISVLPVGWDDVGRETPSAFARQFATEAGAPLLTHHSSVYAPSCTVGSLFAR